MNHNLEQAVDLLHSERCSFVLLKDGAEPEISQDIGIKPLMTRLRVNKSAFAGGVIADKIVGKAAAMMAVLGKAEAVHGEVMSESARQFLEGCGIEYTYGTLVPYIENRTKTGRCPMEETVLDIEDLTDAFEALERTIQRLMNSR